jgi:hypothetical protein
MANPPLFGNDDGFTAYGVEGTSSNGVGVRGVAGKGAPQAPSRYRGITFVAGTGVFGQHLQNGVGVRGQSVAGLGVLGASNSNNGVQGQSTSGIGVYGKSNSLAVLGVSENYGVQGVGHTGVYGVGTGIGVWAQCSDGDGLYATTAEPSSAAVHGHTATDNNQQYIGLAGLFQGNVQIDGHLSKGGGGFRIDHPDRPANEYLNHSFVESPERKNIYDGVQTLNAKGEAEVHLPTWFGSLNQEFRYQLTPLGAPAPNLHISREIRGNAFRIAGGGAKAKVCWQVTAIRKDRWAVANPLTVEEKKRGKARGAFVHPHLYGKSSARATDAALHPEKYQRIRSAIKGLPASKAAKAVVVRGKQRSGKKGAR